jgi:hypothetical protein
MAFPACSGGVLPPAFTGAYAAIAAQFKRLPLTVVGQDRGTAQVGKPGGAARARKWRGRRRAHWGVNRRIKKEARAIARASCVARIGLSRASFEQAGGAHAAAKAYDGCRSDCRGAAVRGSGGRLHKLTISHQSSVLVATRPWVSCAVLFDVAAL